MNQQREYEGQERTINVDLALPNLNLFELNILARFPERPYLIPILRERDASASLVFSLQSHMTLEQWIHRNANDYHDLLSLLEETVTILDQAAEHCLRLDQFCLEPSRICYNTVKKRIELIYLPLRQAEVCFEHQWNQLLNKLDSFAAVSLKPEGSELFQSLITSTSGRYERQNAYLKIIRRWFGGGHEQFHAVKTASEMLSFKPSGTDDLPGPAFETGRPKNFKTSHHIAAESTGVTVKTKKNNKFENIRQFTGDLIQYFRCRNHKNETASIRQNENAMTGWTSEAVEKIQTDAAFLKKNMRYRPEFEGTTLLSEQEKLQGKLVLQNQQACKIYELSKPVTRLGRNTALCDVIIDDDITIGRLHAEVHRIDQGYFIKDLDSLNGTFLNDQRLDSQTMYKLKGNDRLRLSELEILFV